MLLAIKRIKNQKNMLGSGGEDRSLFLGPSRSVCRGQMSNATLSFFGYFSSLFTSFTPITVWEVSPPIEVHLNYGKFPYLVNNYVLILGYHKEKRKKWRGNFWSISRHNSKVMKEIQARHEFTELNSNPI